MWLHFDSDALLCVLALLFPIFVLHSTRGVDSSGVRAPVPVRPILVRWLPATANKHLLAANVWYTE